MPERIQLSRKKGWRMPPNTVSVARPGRYGNPFIAAETARDCVSAAIMANGMQWLPDDWWTVADVLAMYRQWITEQPVTDPSTGEPFNASIRFARPPSLEQLRGKDLACWCPLDQPCHADVLLEIANR